MTETKLAGACNNAERLKNIKQTEQRETDVLHQVFKKVNVVNLIYEFTEYQIINSRFGKISYTNINMTSFQKYFG